jgi:hypothetical protein
MPMIFGTMGDIMSVLVLGTPIPAIMATIGITRLQRVNFPVQF